MAPDVFVDTSGFFSLLVKLDDRHKMANDILRNAASTGRRFITTDYILDETVTLLKARGMGHMLEAFFDAVVGAKGCKVQWVDVALFSDAKGLILKHSDKSWSFTDAISFCVMKRHGIRLALTKDAHYEQAGFTAMLV